MHTSDEELALRLQDAASRVSVGSTYAHYKNPDHHYHVLNLAVLEATDEVCVVYQALYGKQHVFVRTLSSWLSPGTLNGNNVDRFQKINDQDG